MIPRLSPVPRPQIAQRDGTLEAPWQSWFSELARWVQPAYYYPATVTAVAGTLVTGDAASLATPYDGNVYQVTEVAATPGYEIDFAWSGLVKSPTEILVRCAYYENNAVNHQVQIQMYNYVTTNWDSLSLVPDDAFDGTSYFFYMLPFPDFASYTNTSREAKARIYHVSPGQASHKVYVDYVALRSSI